MKKNTPLVILGAGLSGLSCAFYLKRNYSIFEKESRPGGLCRSEKYRRFTFDYTGHMFHFKQEKNRRLIKKVLGGNLVLHRRKAWVYYRETYLPYPFQANLYGLPEDVIKECIGGFRSVNKVSRPGRQKSGNLKEWVRSRFGRGYARHFFIPYNEKFWTIALDRMSAEWAYRFIPVPTLNEVKAGVRGEQKKNFGYNVSFYYPLKGGIQTLPQSFSPHIRSINLKSRAIKISLKEKTVRFDNGKAHKYESLVSTIPLPELIRIIDPVPEHVKKAARELKHVSIFNLNLGIKRENISDKHWIYFPEKKFVFYRVGFPSNFSHSLAPAGMSSVYTEVSYSKNKSLDKRRVTGRIIQDLIKAGIVSSPGDIAVQLPLDIEYAYPLYDLTRRKNVNIIQRFLRAKGIYSIGRFGSWEYLSMEDVINQARRMAHHLNEK